MKKQLLISVCVVALITTHAFSKNAPAPANAAPAAGVAAGVGHQNNVSPSSVGVSFSAPAAPNAAAVAAGGVGKSNVSPSSIGMGFSAPTAPGAAAVAAGVGHQNNVSSTAVGYSSPSVSQTSSTHGSARSR
jgi:hypothetical protein